MFLKFAGFRRGAFFSRRLHTHPEHESEDHVIVQSSHTAPSSQDPCMSLVHFSMDVPVLVDLKENAQSASIHYALGFTLAFHRHPTNT